MTPAPRAVPLALIGTRGFGAVHLRQMAPLRESGRVHLVGVVDIAQPDAGIGAPWFPDLESLLAGVEERPEVVVVATPITTHALLATTALEAGCHVYLEKPPVASFADHEMLCAAAARTGRVVQVGFQARGGGGATRMRELLAAGALGDVRSVDAYGAWVRDRAYYHRSPWAGRRRMDGRRVADGVATNPLAHSIDMALLIAGIHESGEVARVTTELRRARDIEADDTAFVRIDPAPGAGAGVPVHAALTTSASAQEEPWVRLRGTDGTATLLYTEDRLELVGPDGAEHLEEFGRTSLLENLLDHLADPSIALISALASTAAFTTVLEATQTAPDPAPIAAEHVNWIGEGEAAHPVIRDIEEWMLRSLEEGRPFSQIGAPFDDIAAIHVLEP